MLYPLLMQFMMNKPRTVVSVLDSDISIVDSFNRIYVFGSAACIEVTRNSTYFRRNVAEYMWMRHDKDNFWVIVSVDAASRKLLDQYRYLSSKRRDKPEMTPHFYDEEQQHGRQNSKHHQQV